MKKEAIMDKINAEIKTQGTAQRKNMPVAKTSINPLDFLSCQVSTDKSWNTALGISRIRFYTASTAAQKANNIIGSAVVETPYFTIGNITVFVNKLEDGTFVPRVANPRYESNKSWYFDAVLTREAKAQIQKFVMPLINQDSTGDYPEVQSLRDPLYYLEEPEAVTLHEDYDVFIGFKEAVSPAQLNASIFGKSWIQTPVATVNNLTIFAEELPQELKGRRFAFSVTTKRKNSKGETVSNVELTEKARRMILRNADSRAE